MLKSKFEEFASKVQMLANNYGIEGDFETEEYHGQIIYYLNLYDDCYKKSNEEQGLEDLTYLEEE